jgi:hypothetical protein
MKRKIRIGVRRDGEFLPWLGVFTPTVSDKTGDNLIEAFKAARAYLMLKGEVVWADRLVCEWR